MLLRRDNVSINNPNATRRVKVKKYATLPNERDRLNTLNWNRRLKRSSMLNRHNRNYLIAQGMELCTSKSK